jgi:hypothetical protein
LVSAAHPKPLGVLASRLTVPFSVPVCPRSPRAADLPAEAEIEIEAFFVLDPRFGGHGRIRGRAEDVGLGEQAIHSDYEAQEVGGGGDPSTMGVEPPYIIIVGTRGIVDDLARLAFGEAVAADLHAGDDAGLAQYVVAQ